MRRVEPEEAMKTRSLCRSGSSHYGPRHRDSNVDVVRRRPQHFAVDILGLDLKVRSSAQHWAADILSLKSTRMQPVKHYKWSAIVPQPIMSPVYRRNSPQANGKSLENFFKPVSRDNSFRKGNTSAIYCVTCKRKAIFTKETHGRACARMQWALGIVRSESRPSRAQSHPPTWHDPTSISS